MSIETLAKQGRTQVFTGLAGVEAVKLKKLRNEQLKQCFSHFDEQRFRMEFVARVRGMEFYNDAASRSVNATWYALQSMEGSLLWIVNGDDDRADYAKLVPLAKKKVGMMICVGDNTHRLHEVFGGSVATIVDAPSVTKAVHVAYCSNLDDVKVLFSPAGENGISVDEEGSRFTMEVNEL